MQPMLFSLFPQASIAFLSCFVLVLSTFKKPSSRFLSYLSIFILIGLGVFCFKGYPENVFLNNGSYQVDGLTRFGLTVVFLHAGIYWLLVRPTLIKESFKEVETLTLILVSVLGMSLMVGSKQLLLTYLGIELMSLPLYALVVMNAQQKSIEAAVKYFVTGAIASGLLLYGMSLVFVATGSLEYALWANAQTFFMPGSQNLLMSIGVVLMASGLFFKMGVVPFHMWVPDVYEGAPSAITAYISSIPKLITTIVMIRLFSYAYPELIVQWKNILLISGLSSVILGNIMALSQSNLKRLLAYSSISHMGFIFLALWAFTQQGTESALFYAVVYLLLSTASFAVLPWIRRGSTEIESVNDLKGFNLENEKGAAIVMILMFALMGMPPLAGFMSKLAVLNTLINQKAWMIAIIAILMSVVGAAYYLRVIRVTYFEGNAAAAKFEAESHVSMIVMILMVLGVIVLGLWPTGLLQICHQALVG